MIADGVTTSRAGHPDLAYATAGQLKPLHAVAMHAILVVPALAWLLRYCRGREPVRVRLVWSAIAAYTALTGIVGVESVLDISPIAAPPLATVASVLAVVALAAAGAAALGRRRRAR